MLYSLNHPTLLSAGIVKCWKVAKFQNICVKQTGWGGGIRSDRMARGRCEDTSIIFKSRSLTSPALKTLKVMHFQRNAYWEQSCMIRWCPTQLHNSSRRAASLIQSARSKRSVDKVLLILTNLPHAALHATAPPTQNTEHYCSLLTAAWHWRSLITVYFMKM